MQIHQIAGKEKNKLITFSVSKFEILIWFVIDRRISEVAVIVQ